MEQARAASPPPAQVTRLAIPVETSKKNMKWKSKDSTNLKYVDDNLQIDKICMETGTQDGRRRVKHAVQCQNLFRGIIAKAESRGMKVNSSKTALL